MVWSTFTGTVRVVLTLPQRLVDVAQAAFGGGERDPGVVGLVGVGRVAGEIASVDGHGYGLAERSADMLSLLVSLNMALFVFNLIPLLPARRRAHRRRAVGGRAGGGRPPGPAPRPRARWTPRGCCR